MSHFFVVTLPLRAQMSAAAARTLARSTTYSGKRVIAPSFQISGGRHFRTGEPKLQDHPDVAQELVDAGKMSKERAFCLEQRMDHRSTEEEDPAWAAEIEAEEKARENAEDVDRLRVEIQEAEEELAALGAAEAAAPSRHASPVAEEVESSERSPKRAKTAEKGEYHYETIFSRAYHLNSATGCLNEVYVPKKTRVYGSLVLGRCMGLAQVVSVPPTPKGDDDLM